MMSSRTERLYVGGTAFVALLIVLVGWFFLVSPQRDDTASIESQTADAQLHNDSLQVGLNQLRTEQKNSAKYAALLIEGRKALPTRSDMSSFLRFLQSVGTATSTSVSAVSVGKAAPLTPAPGAPAPGASSTGASSAGAASTGAASAGAATGAPAASTGTGGVLGIPITVTVTGTEPALRAFLARLSIDKLDRAVLVTAVTRGAQGTRSSLQVAMTAFVRPATASSAVPTAGN